MHAPAIGEYDEGTFDLHAFLATPAEGRTVVKYRANKAVIAQGEVAETVFFVLHGNVKLTFVSDDGKEAVFAFLGEGDFFGQNCLVSSALRRFSATTASECLITRLPRATMQRLLKEHAKFSEAFIVFLLRRAMRMQEDIVNHLVNSSQKRLARVLLQLACDQERSIKKTDVHISHELLAEMVGTTRSRISLFMSEFRRAGFIDYNASGNLRIDGSLLRVLGD